MHRRIQRVVLSCRSAEEPCCSFRLTLATRDPSQTSQTRRDTHVYPQLAYYRPALLQIAHGSCAVALMLRDMPQIQQRPGAHELASKSLIEQQAFFFRHEGARIILLQ